MGDRKWTIAELEQAADTIRILPDGRVVPREPAEEQPLILTQRKDLGGTY